MEIKLVGKLRKIPLIDLRIQYVNGVTPLELWNYDMRLKYSPHVELMKLFLKHGFDLDKAWNTRYVQERQNRYKIGQKDWTDSWIRKHLKRRYGILKSLKRYGFKTRLRKGLSGQPKPVAVLKEPLWTSRFGMKENWLGGMEIYDGAGACSAAYALGWKTILGFYAIDARKPGDKGKFEEKLKNVKGVW